MQKLVSQQYQVFLSLSYIKIEKEGIFRSHPGGQGGKGTGGRGAYPDSIQGGISGTYPDARMAAHFQILTKCIALQVAHYVYTSHCIVVYMNIYVEIGS